MKGKPSRFPFFGMYPRVRGFAVCSVTRCCQVPSIQLNSHQHRGDQLRYATTIAMCAAIAACATSGTDFNEGAIAQLVPGKTTEGEAVEVLGGKPNHRTISANGNYLLVWVFAQARPGKVQSRSLGIVFDKGGKMIRVSSQSNTETN